MGEWVGGWVGGGGGGGVWVRVTLLLGFSS